ncbi:MAG: hypothetical protein WKF42_03945 [Solirubrobacteraceae bacterium]
MASRSQTRLLALELHPTIRDEWSAALRSRQIATCSITTLGLLYAARNADEVRELEADEATLRDIPRSSCPTR